MNDLEQLIKQREELDRQIEQLHRDQREGVLNEIRRLMDLHNLTTEDLMIKPRRTGFRAPAQVKYRDPETGATWSGRGRAPRWLEGKDRAAYEV
jgi:DNA-binding protein H-NS